MTVYKITNLINGKMYIGQTKGPLRVRWLQHCKARSHATAVRNAIQKYGQDNFTIAPIFETVCPVILSYKEIEFIKNLNSLAPNGYNLTEGGEGSKHSDSTKKKLSEARKGALNPMFGKQLSAEHRAKISAALTGNKRPQAVKDKIRANHNSKSDKNLTYRRKTQPQTA